MCVCGCTFVLSLVSSICHFYVVEKISLTAFELLRSTWLVDEGSLAFYENLVKEMLAGNAIDLGPFASLPLPATPPNVALIPMAGMLTKADVCGGMGSRSLANMIAAAAANPQYDAIILMAESCPGGNVDGTEALAAAVAQANAAKPVVGAISGMNCSGGVWAMAGTAEQYATSTTDMVGCIGVMGRIKAATGSDAGVVEIISDQTPEKNSEFKNADLLKARYINPVADSFLAAVKAGRGERLKDEGFLRGGTYAAPLAAKAGLIDGVMPFNKIVARANYLARMRKKQG